MTRILCVLIIKTFKYTTYDTLYNLTLMDLIQKVQESSPTINKKNYVWILNFLDRLN